ncbi:protein enabled homolog [Folsomia candida]|uniref:protein enabled homolog n=1 Tax=Folsomia candida TaxID=158441 RepID=UPI000B8F162F|nr:protein enabled homolog [Folsomia candida]
MSERGYLEGVPLRLNSKFYPLPRPQFKEIDIHIPVDALQDEYDFSLERGTLMQVKTWEEEYRLEQQRRALRAKQEEEARLQAEEERKRLEEEERIRRAEEDRIRRIEEEKARLIEEERSRLAEEELAHLAELERVRLAEETRVRLAEEERTRVLELERIRLADEERAHIAELENVRIEEETRVRLAEEARVSLSKVGKVGPLEDSGRVRLAEQDKFPGPTPPAPAPPVPQPPPTNCYPISQPPLNAYPQQQQQPPPPLPSQWNPNYYVPVSPSAPDIISGRTDNSTVTPTTTCQTNAPLSSGNSFKKYYFPLLTSMADSRSMRDQQNQFSSNLNITYNSIHSSTNHQVSSSNPHPYLCANPPPAVATVQQQQFPILGSLSHPPASNHLWPGGTGIRSPMCYNNSVNNSAVLNGPLVPHDSVLKPNGSHLSSPDNLSGTSPNGTHHTLR